MSTTDPKSNRNSVSEADKVEGPTLSQLMAQLKVILAEVSVVKTCLSVCSGKMDEMQKQLKKQEELVKDCNKKIETFEMQNESLQRENGELKARLHGLKHPQENNECGGDSQVDTPVATSTSDDIIAVVETMGNSHIQDYYWKEYIEEIPEEALPGGTDLNGNVTYIGQTIHEERVVPGNLDATRQMLIYTMEEKQNATVRNIKILCVHTPGAYEWVRTNTRDMRFLNHRHLVAGGHYSEYPYFVGRTVCGGQVVVGKIYYEKFACAAAGKVYYMESNFEVLVYNPRTPAKVTISKKTSLEGSNSIYCINVN